jgi:hypothetical protein
MKKVILNNIADIQDHIVDITHAAEQAQLRITEMSESTHAMDFMAKLKFEKMGYDPLDSDRDLNFIEQLNQTFTYLASMKAAEFLFNEHLEISSLTLNLGTAPGSDLETSDCGGIAAEVFAATKPSSNNKLNKDIQKVSETDAKYKYSFFMCPDVESGEYRQKSTSDVIVWSLGQ